MPARRSRYIQHRYTAHYTTVPAIKRISSAKKNSREIVQSRLRLWCAIQDEQAYLVGWTQSGASILMGGWESNLPHFKSGGWPIGHFNWFVALGSSDSCEKSELCFTVSDVGLDLPPIVGEGVRSPWNKWVSFCRYALRTPLRNTPEAPLSETGSTYM